VDGAAAAGDAHMPAAVVAPRRWRHRALAGSSRIPSARGPDPAGQGNGATATSDRSTGRQGRDSRVLQPVSCDDLQALSGSALPQ
jgi:hypothetical protein